MYHGSHAKNEQTRRLTDYLRNKWGPYISALVIAAAGAAATHMFNDIPQANGGETSAGPSTSRAPSVARRGHPGNVIQCNETGKVYASQNLAAHILNIDPAELSQHMRGKRHHAGGLTFTKIGEAS